MLRLLREHDYAENMRSDLAEVKQRLVSGGANLRIAELVMEMLAA